LRNQDTAVLIDGVRFRDASSITGDATPFLSDFTLTSVGRIEVLRGSGSSLYGTNAIGGVIDLQTPAPQSELHGQISGSVGGLGLGRFRANMSDGTSDGKFTFNIGVSRTAYTKGIDGQDNAHNTNFQSKVIYQPTAKTNISGRFFVSDAYVRLNSNPDTTVDIPFSNAGIIAARPGINFTPDLNDPDDFQRSKFFNGQLVLSQTLGSKAVLQAYYSGLKTSRRNDSGPLPSGFAGTSTSFFDGLIQTANAHVDWTLNSANTLTTGYEFEHEKFANAGQTPSGLENFFVKAYQSSNTFYAQDLVTLLEGRLNFAGGFRAQFFGLGNPGFSLANAPYSNLNLSDPPAAYTLDGSAAYTFRRSNTKLRAHVGNGYRVPSLYERFGTFYSTFGRPEFVALGDPTLKPERSIAYDAGLEQNIGGKAKLTAVYFYTRLIDTIGFGNVVVDIGNTVRPFGGYENQKGGIARGAEFSARFRPFTTTDIFASYTYTNSDQREPQVTGSGVIQTLGIPVNQFTLVATQRIKKFWVNFDFLGTSSYLAPIFSSTTFNSYVYRFNGNRRGDATAGYTFVWKQDRVSMRVYGTVENLFGQEYYENGFRTVGRTARIGLSFGF
jgi:iron complex outermembrane receptor protein